MITPRKQMTETIEPLEPGIYLGLTSERYHADSALGSTNLRQMLMSPPDYWWGSWMNPAKPDETETADRRRGHAIHNFVLEGRQSFDARYIRRPDDDDGATPPDKAKLTKEWNVRAAREGKQLLHADTFDRIMISGQMIIANPELATAFTGGIPEVSVFWQRDGVRLKARMDYLKVRSITDLKSISNPLKIDFIQACRREIRYRKLPIQAKLYMDGRSQMARFLAEGRLYGQDCDKELVSKIASNPAHDTAFVFVFYQTKGAPLTWGTKFSPGKSYVPGSLFTEEITEARSNPLLTEAAEQIEDALEKFRTFRERFGTTPWVLAEPLAECHPEDLPVSYY